MAEIPAPGALKLNGNVAENWRRWKRAFELYMTATEKDKKSQKIQCATFLTLAGETAIAVYETFDFDDNEKDKIEPLVLKFEACCLPKKNVTHERHMLNLRKQKPETIEQFVAELRKLAKNCEEMASLPIRSSKTELLKELAVTVHELHFFVKKICPSNDV